MAPFLIRNHKVVIIGKFYPEVIKGYERIIENRKGYADPRESSH